MKSRTDSRIRRNFWRGFTGCASSWWITPAAIRPRCVFRRRSGEAESGRRRGEVFRIVFWKERYAPCAAREKGCKCTVWKDALTRGNGPALNEKLMRLILEKRQVKGSTGTIILQEGWLRFYPNGSEVPSVSRSVAYEKKA